MSKAEREYHGRTAANCFNKTWDYLVMKERTLEDDRQMLLLAHASRYHWGIVGTPRNKAVGEWQISRVYAALGEPTLALRFAKASLASCRKGGLVDLVHTAYEAVARAHALAGDNEVARRCLDRARKHLGGLILDDEQRRVYSEQIQETEAMIRQPPT